MEIENLARVRKRENGKKGSLQLLLVAVTLVSRESSIVRLYFQYTHTRHVMS